MVEDLNYHHFYYFWVTAREGSISAASRVLRLTQPTVSAQIRTLERQLGERLFDRRAGRLSLTETGQRAYEYADEIFGLGRDFLDSLRGGAHQRVPKLRIGIADVVPKLISHRVLAPALALAPAPRLICEEGKTEELLAELSIQRLDLVLADAPIAGAAHVRAFNHLLGQCGVSFFCQPKLARRLPKRFPELLEGAPLLVPTEDSLLRRALMHWLETHALAPRIVAEFHDSALLKVFGREGFGIFAGPSAIEREIAKEYEVKVLGRTDEIQERYYAITLERRVKNSALRHITETARKQLFWGASAPGE